MQVLTDEQRQRKYRKTDEWKKAHPDRVREVARKSDRKRREARRGEINAYQREWATKNPERAKVHRKKYRDKIRREAIEHYGGKCVCCGETEMAFLCLDHINNDGGQQRLKILGSRTGDLYHIFRRVGYPDDLQVLCANCNMAKSIVGICPHKGQDI